MDNFEQFIVKSRYCKWLPEQNRRENWPETVGRYMTYMMNRFSLRYNDEDLRNIWESIDFFGFPIEIYRFPIISLWNPTEDPVLPEGGLLTGGRPYASLTCAPARTGLRRQARANMRPAEPP